MDDREVLARADQILKMADVEPGQLTVENFFQYAELVSQCVRDWPQRKKDDTPWLMDWAKRFRGLYDNFARSAAADPMILYRPANRAALEFHSSNAFVRYFRAGNRTSKTQSGYAEHYFVTTEQHKWREFPTGPHSTFIIGVNFSKYCPAVFEKKFLTGEQGNPLSPMFPAGGKWLHRYDERRHEIQIACPKCANAGKAATCPHPKSTIRLFSDTEGWEVLQGGSYVLGHFDEHIDEEFFNESVQRIQTAGRSSCLLVTGTPLHGHEAWEHQRLTKIHLEGPPRNRISPEDPSSAPFVSLHEIDQFEAGLVPHERIKMSMGIMDEFEVESRVYGRPAPLAKNPVFNRKALAELRRSSTSPGRGVLRVEEDTLAVNIVDTTRFGFHEQDDGPLRIWEEPVAGGKYIVSVDTAKGLAGRDASCASVLKVCGSEISPRLSLVAQWHGWINPLLYAEEVFKLAVWYNSALTVIELTGGYGEAVMLKMRQDYCYWNLFRDESNHAQAGHTMDSRYGVETNIRTKPFMVAALQQFVSDRAIDIWCEATISEMVAFEQERTKSGLTTRYRGVSGAHDDRVMSLVIGASVALSSAVLEFTASEPEGLLDIKGKYDTEWEKIHQDIRDSDSVDPFDFQ